MRVATACLTLFCGLMALANPDRMGFTIAVRDFQTPLLPHVVIDFLHSRFSKCILIASMFVGWVELLSMLEIGLVTPAADIGIGQGFFGSCRNIGGTIASKAGVSTPRVSSTMTLTKSNQPAYSFPSSAIVSPQP